MKLLQPDSYYKVQTPLNKIGINTLFARFVVEKRVKGAVYVDDIERPETFYIVHPYGMSLLFGKTGNDEFNSGFIDYSLNINKTRNRYEWLQVYPDEWNKELLARLGDNLVESEDNKGNTFNKKIEKNTRVNFKFNKERYLDFRTKYISKEYTIVQTNRELFGKMEGSVVPKYFWNSPEEFLNDGVGFSLIYENKLVSTAYSAFILEKQLELGIETIDMFRGKGFAMYVCSSLIDYCIDNGYEPVWSCRLENIGSYKLAIKLGFEPTLYIPYYRLVV
ncbi:MAG: GNAT family N-acetyltransferase [Bacteroidales bacterium]|nr:GNAT family N-acetyltransferase [Bacteroidales bacterium]